MRYIYQLKVWPKFTWDWKVIQSLLGEVRSRQGRLMGQMEGLGFSSRSEAVLKTLTLDIIKSSEIEGEILNKEQVRSSIARRLGMKIGGLVASDRNVDGIVEMMMDVASHFEKPLTKDRLFGWHASLFPGGRSGMHKIRTGAWRDDAHGPMRVVSGRMGREKIHYEAPAAHVLNEEMRMLLKWFNGSDADNLDPVLKAAIVHLWFITIHPFDDGNGRIARAIADMQLARADRSQERFYSMSVQIRKQRNKYYEILEKTQKTVAVGKEGIDITPWIQWFLNCLNQALENTENVLSSVFEKEEFWKSHKAISMNERQRIMLNKLFEGFEGKLTTVKWAKITKVSHDTALRDILDLIEKKVLIKDSAGGRSVSYLLKSL